MAILRRYLLLRDLPLLLIVVVISVIILPASAQNPDEFNREMVLARWNSLLDSIISGRTESVKDLFFSRDGAPPELYSKQTIREAFNPKGFTFSYNIEEYRKPRTENSLTIVNENYKAILSKPKGKDDWLLNEVKKPKAKNDHLRKVAWLVCGNVLLPEWIADGSFVITRTERRAPGSGPLVVRVHFVYDQLKRKSPDVPEHIKSGYIDFDPGHSYCTMGYEYQLDTKVSQEMEQGIHEYDFVGEVPLLKTISTISTSQSVKHGLLKSTAKWSYKIDYDVNVADEEFRLSYYGLPEPMGIVWKQPTKWWFWIALAAFGSLALGLLLRKLKRRFENQSPEPVKK